MKSSIHSRAILGIILIVIGSIFLLDNLGYEIELPWFLFRWPIVFIIIGMVNLLSGKKQPAFIFFGIGVLFYLEVFDVLRFRDVWPIGLIIIGLVFIFRKRSSDSKSTNENADFDETAILGGVDKQFTSQDLKGGKLTSLLGGCKIDLRYAQIKESATIDIFCMFGGVEVMVPANWKVNVDATVILGGFSDKRTNIDTDEIATLNIHGFVMFGGGELKS